MRTTNGHMLPGNLDLVYQQRLVSRELQNLNQIWNSSDYSARVEEFMYYLTDNAYGSDCP